MPEEPGWNWFLDLPPHRLSLSVPLWFYWTRSGPQCSLYSHCDLILEALLLCHWTLARVPSLYPDKCHYLHIHLKCVYLLCIHWYTHLFILHLIGLWVNLLGEGVVAMTLSQQKAFQGISLCLASRDTAICSWENFLPNDRWLLFWRHERWSKDCAVGDAIFEKGIKADHQSNPGWLFKSYWALLLLPNVKIWRRERFIDGHARRQMARALKTPNSLKAFSKAPF